MQVPFVDLKKQYLSIKEEIDGAIESVINETAFIKGKYVSKFEQEYNLCFVEPEDDHLFRSWQDNYEEDDER